MGVKNIMQDMKVLHALSSETKELAKLASRQISSSSEGSDSSIGIRRRCTSTSLKLEDLSLVKTVGTGTFARVCLVKNIKNRDSRNFLALKVLSKHDLIRLKQVDHVKNEKNILKEVHHPFLLEMLWSGQDSHFLYLLFPFVVGGELFSYLRRAGHFSSRTSLFYTAEIVSALNYLHSLNIVYRDLKPENLLINSDGHLKIIDFGFAKHVRDRTWTSCGTPEYLAPEIILSKGHNMMVDWWSLGVLVFEMLAGYPPFFDTNPFCLYEKILGGEISWPERSIGFDPIGRDFIRRLLVRDPRKRLGGGRKGGKEVMKHFWFHNTDWVEVAEKKIKPPILPTYRHQGDTSNFDDYRETDWRNIPNITDKEDTQFSNF